MTITYTPATEVKVGDNVRFSACKPHVIDRIEPSTTPGLEGSLAFYSGKWGIVVSAKTIVRVITD